MKQDHSLGGQSSWLCFFLRKLYSQMAKNSSILEFIFSDNVLNHFSQENNHLEKFIDKQG